MNVLLGLCNAVKHQTLSTAIPGWLRLGFGCLVLLLAGCVTVTDSRFDAKKNKDKALETYTLMGRSYIQQGNTQLAKTKLDRALEIDRKYAPAHATYGLLWEAEGEWALAENYFKDALRYDAGYSRARSFYGAFLYKQKRYAEAAEQLAKAAADVNYEARSQAYENLGLAHMRSADKVAAEAAFRRSIQLDNRQVRALLALSELLYSQQRYLEAQQFYERFTYKVQRRLETQNAQSLWLGIRLAQQLKLKDQEGSYVLQLRNRFPSSPQYRTYQQTLELSAQNSE